MTNDTPAFGAMNRSFPGAGPPSPWERRLGHSSRSQRSRNVTPPMRSKQDDYLYQTDCIDPVPAYEDHLATTPVASGYPASPTDMPTPDDNVPTLHCEDCGEVFRGQYRKGNLRRHVKHKHSSARNTLHQCIYCPTKRYKRYDALKKHLWKQHRIGDKPKKRQVENYGKERRIYMDMPPPVVYPPTEY